VDVAYHPAARAELRRVTRRYERERRGLGLAFLTAVREAEALLTSHPELGMPLGDANRRQLVRRFPYGLIYRPEAQRIYVLAVAHWRRRPDYWLERK
jgi:toxin ParE1/3/4